MGVFYAKSYLSQNGLEDLLDVTLPRPAETHPKYRIWKKLSNSVVICLYRRMDNQSSNSLTVADGICQ
jgi:hypothetical protein